MWAVLQVSAPRMPEGWPFPFEQTVFYVVLLLLVYAWVLLLIPANWEAGIFEKAGFRTTFSILALWWIGLISVVLWGIALVASKSTVLILPLSIYV